MRRRPPLPVSCAPRPPRRHRHDRPSHRLVVSVLWFEHGLARPARLLESTELGRRWQRTTASSRRRRQLAPAASPPSALPHFYAPSSTSSTYEYSPQELTALVSASLSSFLAHDAPLAASLPAARTFYSLKTSRSPPKAYDAFWAFARERWVLEHIPAC
ncbi:hypothetical protein C8R45DRAFT_86801 [Mycena sanguinolenta]|nr:hypothetical protein C8R45DRAFT_86801 [Mycena sanguinolenta]